MLHPYLGLKCHYLSAVLAFTSCFEILPPTHVCPLPATPGHRHSGCPPPPPGCAPPAPRAFRFTRAGPGTEAFSAGALRAPPAPLPAALSRAGAGPRPRAAPPGGGGSRAALTIMSSCEVSTVLITETCGEGTRSDNARASGLGARCRQPAEAQARPGPAPAHPAALPSSPLSHPRSRPRPVPSRPGGTMLLLAAGSPPGGRAAPTWQGAGRCTAPGSGPAPKRRRRSPLPAAGFRPRPGPAPPAPRSLPQRPGTGTAPRARRCPGLPLTAGGGG